MFDWRYIVNLLKEHYYYYYYLRSCADLSPQAEQSSPRTSAVRSSSGDILAGGGSSFERGCGRSCVQRRTPASAQRQQPGDVRLMQLRLRAGLEACVGDRLAYARQTDIRKTLPRTQTAAAAADDDALPSRIFPNVLGKQ